MINSKSASEESHLLMHSNEIAVKSQGKCFSPLIMMMHLRLNRQTCFINTVFKAFKAFLLAEKIQEITIN